MDNPSSSSKEPKKRQKYPRGPQFVVKVTEPIMKHAKVRDSSHCMIAMAVRDVMPKATSISVDLQTIRFSIPENRCRYTYLTPRIAQVALIQFDQGTLPEPFSFRLTGSHVTRMSFNPKVQTPRARSDAQKKSIEKANQVYYGKNNDLNKQTIVMGENSTAIPRRVGGTPPPLGNFARRRKFGLRALKV